MAIKPDTLIALASLNLSGEQMAGVLRILASEVSCETERRAEAARKKREYRARVQGQSYDSPEDKARTVPETAALRACVDNKITTTLQEVSNNTPPVVPPLSSKPASRVSRGTRIPDDWEPRFNEIEFARLQGYSDQEIADMADHYRDHWIASSQPNAVKRDWHRGFRNWIRRDMKDRKRNGRSPRNTMADSWSIASQVLAEQDRREGIRREGDENDYGLLPGLREDAA